MPGPLWRSWKDWMVVYPCNTRDAPSLFKRRRPIRYSCEPVTNHPHTLPGTVPVLAIRTGPGRRPSPNSTPIVPKKPRLTRLLTAGPQPARWQPLRLGSLRFSKRLRWKAIQKAKRKGMSIRGIARELGINRATVRKYIDADTPPMRQVRSASTTPTPDTMAA